MGKAAFLVNEPHVCVGGVDPPEPVRPIELPSCLNREFGLALVDTEEQVREWIKPREGSLV